MPRKSDSTVRKVYMTRSPTSNGSSPAVFYADKVWVPPNRKSRFANGEDVKVLKSAKSDGNKLVIRSSEVVPEGPGLENYTEEWVPAKSLITVN